MPNSLSSSSGGIFTNLSMISCIIEIQLLKLHEFDHSKPSEWGRYKERTLRIALPVPNAHRLYWLLSHNYRLSWLSNLSYDSIPGFFMEHLPKFTQQVLFFLHYSKTKDHRRSTANANMKRPAHQQDLSINDRVNLQHPGQNRT